MPRHTHIDDKFNVLLTEIYALDTKLAQIQWDLNELKEPEPRYLTEPLINSLDDVRGGEPSMPRLEISPAQSLIFADLKRWAKNAAIFLVPVLLLVLADLQNYVTPDMRHGAILLYLINLIIDMVRKWQAMNRYQ